MMLCGGWLVLVPHGILSSIKHYSQFYFFLPYMSPIGMFQILGVHPVRRDDISYQVPV